MPRHAGITPLPPNTLDASQSTPLYRQVYERVRGEILAGRLIPGTRLPSSRALASELGVARNTTALAYQLLALEGYLEGRVGDGTRVARLRGQVAAVAVMVASGTTAHVARILIRTALHHHSPRASTRHCAQPYLFPPCGGDGAQPRLPGRAGVAFPRSSRPSPRS